jgi:predicted esterase YcpF (UPF0227 family)
MIGVTMLILLHGFGSNGIDSNTNKAIAARFPDELVFTPSYQYQDANNTAFFLKEYVDKLLDEHHEEQIIFIGISLGGFWARYLANMYRGSKLVMLNPALEAHNTIRKHIGVVCDFKTGMEITMTEKHCDAFRDYYIHTDRPDIPITIIVADDDDVVPPNAADDLIGKQRAKIIHTTGGHRFNGTLDAHLADIEKAVYTIAM